MNRDRSTESIREFLAGALALRSKRSRRITSVPSRTASAPLSATGRSRKPDTTATLSKPHSPTRSRLRISGLTSSISAANSCRIGLTTWSQGHASRRSRPPSRRHPFEATPRVAHNSYVTRRTPPVPGRRLASTHRPIHGPMRRRTSTLRYPATSPVPFPFRLPLDQHEALATSPAHVRPVLPPTAQLPSIPA